MNKKFLTTLFLLSGLTLKSIKISRRVHHHPQVLVANINNSLLITATELANFTRNMTDSSAQHHSTITQIFRLLNMNADPLHSDDNGTTALSIAQASENNEVLTIFAFYFNGQQG
jgi:hypothetical protein